MGLGHGIKLGDNQSRMKTWWTRLEERKAMFMGLCTEHTELK